jgi:hypothetical protein
LTLSDLNLLPIKTAVPMANTNTIITIQQKPYNNLQLPLNRQIPRGHNLTYLLVEKRRPKKNGRKFRIGIKEQTLKTTIGGGRAARRGRLKARASVHPSDATNNYQTLTRPNIVYYHVTLPLLTGKYFDADGATNSVRVALSACYSGSSSPCASTWAYVRMN